MTSADLDTEFINKHFEKCKQAKLLNIENQKNIIKTCLKRAIEESSNIGRTRAIVWSAPNFYNADNREAYGQIAKELKLCLFIVNDGNTVFFEWSPETDERYHVVFVKKSTWIQSCMIPKLQTLSLEEIKTQQAF